MAQSEKMWLSAESVMRNAITLNWTPEQLGNTFTEFDHQTLQLLLNGALIVVDQYDGAFIIC